MTPFVENNCKSKQKQYCVPSIKLCSHQNHRLFHKTQLICSQITLGIIKVAVQQYVISIIIEHEYPSIHTRYAINTKLSVSLSVAHTVENCFRPSYNLNQVTFCICLIGRPDLSIIFSVAASVLPPNSPIFFSNKLTSIYFYTVLKCIIT